MKLKNNRTGLVENVRLDVSRYLGGRNTLCIEICHADKNERRITGGLCDCITTCVPGPRDMKENESVIDTCPNCCHDIIKFIKDYGLGVPAGRTVYDIRTGRTYPVYAFDMDRIAAYAGG